MKKLISAFLAVVLIIVLAVPAQAADSDSSPWIELLETETVNDSGNNLVTFSSTSTIFRIKTPQYMRCTKVDMLITHPSGYAPTSVKVRYNNVYYTLTMAKIDSCTTRVYGDNIPDNLYADLVFQINKSGSVSITYHVLSCRVSPLTSKELKATAYALINGQQYNTPFSFEFDNPDADDIYGDYQFPIVVTDWQKFDKITISGSVGAMALNSVRASIGGLGLPYQMNYAVSNISGTDANSTSWAEIKYYTYDESYRGTTETLTYTENDYIGKILFTITIDLSGVDRTSTDHLICYFTSLVSEWLGYTIQITGVTGLVDIADTSDVSWWNRFTSFLSQLFGEGEGQEAINDLGQSADSISQGAADIHDFEQSQQAVLNSGFSTIQSAVSFTSFSAALLFVQKYANLTVSGISKYMIVFTLPLFLGLFFYLCSRVPGITRWKSRPPQKKGGKSP